MALGPEWFAVEQRGYDSSGRPLRNTKYMWAIWDALREHPSIRPFAWKLTMVQGAFMSWSGGGASRSDGFHDLAGCDDVRTWNLTTSEIDTLIRVARGVFALGAWRRDYSSRHGGMSPHCHWGQGGDRPLSYGASLSWRSYVSRGDGLAGYGGDYEWRPSSLVLTPPGWVFEEELTMDAEVRNAFERLNERLTNIRDGLEADIDALATKEAKRAIAARKTAEKAAVKAKATTSRIISKLGGVQDAVAEIESLLAEGDVEGAKTRLGTLASFAKNSLADDPDVDGKDNPADS